MEKSIDMWSYFSLRLVATVALLTAACFGPSDQVGTSKQNLVGGDSAEDNTGDIASADIITSSAYWEVGCTATACTYSDCSAVFITPTRLLTANHCITGTGTSFADAHPGSTPNSVDINVYGAKTVYNNVDAIRIPIKSWINNVAVPIEVSTASQDFSILEVDPTMQERDWREVLRLNLQRPSLTAPTSQAIFGAGYGQGVAGGFLPSVEGTPPYHRTIATLTGATQSGLWTFTGDARIVSGDSGSALFYLRSDSVSSRDVFAIASYGDGSTSYWADLTSAANALWLRNHLVDPDSNHTKEWLAQHPYPSGKTERWFGETDYTGVCQQGDVDCDGWYDSHDNCPDLFNPTQDDSNNDGIGDACPCPCDNNADNTGKKYQDYDGDGFCAVACPDVNHPSIIQVQDNCPKVTNKDQANCNYDAEIARQLEVKGDACDPVPCPASSATAITHTIAGSSGGNPQLGGYVYGRQVRDRVDTIGIRSQNPTCDYVETLNGEGGCVAHVDLPGLMTRYRFCQYSPNDPNSPSDCFALTNIADHFKDDPDTHTNPWHQITFGTDATGEDYARDYNQMSPPSGTEATLTPASMTWSYRADKTRWLTQSPATIPPPQNYPNCTDTMYGGDGSDPSSGVTCLSGRLWSHVNTTLGDTDDSNGVHGAQLANNYFPDISAAGLVDSHTLTYVGGAPAAFYRPDATYGFSYSGTGVWHPVFLWKTLPDPYAPIASLGHVSGVFVVNTSGGQLGVLQDDGTNALMPVGGGALVDSALQSELSSSSYVWATNVDPSAAVSTIAGGVEGVALSTDGTSMLDIALNVGGVLKTRSEAAFPDFIATPDDAHPQAHTNFTAFYSGAAGGVFMLGGSDPTSGVPLHDIWFRGMGSDWWAVSDYVFDTLLASTYSFGDRKLYVLDHSIVSANGIATDTARLVRIDIQANAVESLGSWPYTPVYAKYALATDVDGSVLLAATNNSSTQVGRLAVAASGSAYVTEIDSNEPGNLAFAPVVDPGGYAVTTIVSGVSTTRRYTELPFGAPGNYTLGMFFPQPIMNGGFESGTLSGWSPSGPATGTSNTSVHSGTYSALLGSTAHPNGASTIQQTFTVPTGGGTLKLWYSNVCPGILTYDWFTATLLGPNSTTIATIVPKTCASSSGWTQATLDLSQWKGQTVTVVLANHAISPCAVCQYAKPTYTYVDDVTVN